MDYFRPFVSAVGPFLLSVSLLFECVYPYSWFKKSLIPTLESVLVSSWDSNGRVTLMLVFVTAPILVAMVITLCLRRPLVLDVVRSPTTRFLSARTGRQLTLSEGCLWGGWIALLTSWWVGRSEKHGTWDDPHLDSIAVTFGLFAVLSMQFLLVVVAWGSPLPRQLLCLSPQAMVNFHVLVGSAIALFTAVHGILFWIIWARAGSTFFWDKALDWRMRPVANVQGEIALIAGVVIFFTSLPQIRRRVFEAFAHTHTLCAVVFYAGTILHWEGAIWYLLPGLLTYVCDKMSAPLAVGMSGRRVHIETVRCHHDVISLRLRCKTSKKTSTSSEPQPLQHLKMNIPEISALEWHPFTLSRIQNKSEDTVFQVGVKVISGGWTERLRQIIDSGRLSVEPSSSLDIRISDWYGIGFDYSTYLSGHPLLMVCGGSGGTPFAAILEGLGRLRPIPNQVPITLVWVCRTSGEMAEWVQSLELMQIAKLCPALHICLFVTSPDSDPNSVFDVEAGNEVPAECEVHTPEDISSTSYLPRLAVLCHIWIPASVLASMAIVVAEYPGRPPPLSLLYAFILGVAAGTALAHAHAHLHNAIGFETRLNRAKVLSYKVLDEESQELSNTANAPPVLLRAVRVRDLPPESESLINVETHDELTPVDSAQVIDRSQETNDVRKTSSGRVTCHLGRPDIAQVLTDFGLRLKEYRAAGDDYCVGHLAPVVMAAGPTSLVESTKRVAISLGYSFESVSFEI